MGSCPYVRIANRLRSSRVGGSTSRKAHPPIVAVPIFCGCGKLADLALRLGARGKPIDGKKQGSPEEAAMFRRRGLNMFRRTGR